MKKATKRPSWRTMLRQAKKTRNVGQRKTLMAQANLIRREEREATLSARLKKKSKTMEKVVRDMLDVRTPPKPTLKPTTRRSALPQIATANLGEQSIPNVGLENAANWVEQGGTGTTAIGSSDLNRVFGIGTKREARHMLMGDDSAPEAAIITPFDAAMDAITELTGGGDAKAIHDILHDFALYHRNDLERGHIETLRRVHEANAANVVRSYMALIDGIGHASGGPVPPYVVIPGLMAVRVYDALRDAGHKPE